MARLDETMIYGYNTRLSELELSLSNIRSTVGQEDNSDKTTRDQ